MIKPSFDVAIALVRRDGRWLVARRSAAAHLGGLWEFPGGKIEPNETPTHAALRELSEECDIVARPLDALTVRTHEYVDRIVTIHPIDCVWERGEARNPAQSEFLWITLAEIEHLPMPAANALVIDEMKRLYPDP